MKYEHLHINYQRAEEFMDVMKALCFLNGSKYEDIIQLDTYFNYHYHIAVDGKILNGYSFHSGKDRYDQLCRTKEDLVSKGSNAEIICTRTNWGEKVDWYFFKVKGFKKGTMHFEFSDEALLDLFNYEVAKAKGWQLPKQRTQPTSKQEKKELTLFE